MRPCPNCGRESDSAAPFCRHCGAQLSASSRREQRKTVTILFCDLVESTGLAEGDPETFRRIQTRYFERMRRIIERHGGTVEKFVGDEVMAVFGVPVVHEDDALRAVRAAREMLDELHGLNEELEARWPGLRLQARIGVNTGQVLASDPEQGHLFVSGEPVVVAKRLEQAAQPGEILIGKETYPLVKHAVAAGPLMRIRVKGKQAPVAKRRLDRVDPDAPGVARRLHARLVGREEEFRLLQAAFERTITENSCRLLTVAGPAGIGKSRLVAELLSSVEDRARTSVGRCLSYGEGITFWPLADALRGLRAEETVAEALDGSEHRDAILEIIRGVTGASQVASSPEQTFWAVRRAFEALARKRPLVVCFEDVHWAEPALLDLVEYVVGWSRGAPILVIALARPELVDRRPQWFAPQPTSDAVVLEPLTRVEMEALLADLAAEVPIIAEVRERIAAVAEGNPLFVEQITALAAEQDGGGRLAIPPSIQALLAERLDRLTPGEREVIERASVVGRDFPVAAVAGLLPEEERPSLTRQLFTLVHKGLIRPDPSPSADEDRFSFEHVLVRDAAYEAMPKERRAALSERFAEWLEALGRGQDLEELIAYHLEQAHRHRVELGVVDEHTDGLALRAGELLARAGARALGRNDVHAALKLLGRAIALRSDGEPAVAARLDLSQALFLSGQFAAAAEQAVEAAARAAAAGDEAGELRARLMRARIAAQTPREDGDSEGLSGELLAVAKEARPVFARVGNELGLAEAWFATAWAHLIRCRWAAMLEAVEHALEHVRRVGSTPWAGELPAWQGTAMFYGPTRVDDVLSWYVEQQAQHPIALTQQAMLEAMRGNFDGARALARSAEGAAEELGQRLWLAAGGMAVWEVEMLAGDVSAAERAVRRSCELLEELGDAGYRWMAAGQLATSLYTLGRLDDAEEWTRKAEASAAKDDVVSQMLWRQVRAQLLARRGEHAEAERFAREAVSLVEDTDMLNWHANALVDLAGVLAAARRAVEAREQLEQALALYERKGNVVGAARTRASLEGLRPVGES